VATRVTISGRIDSRNLAPGKLCSVSSKNAFINAVTPGFEKKDDGNIKVKEERDIPS
jgi:hypothetical protein